MNTWNKTLLVCAGFAAQSAGASTYVFSGTTLDFGDIYKGDTSATQIVDIINVSGTTVTPSFAGGAPSGDFSVVQNCAGVTLAPGESCQFFYTYVPSSEGVANGSSTVVIDGESYTVEMEGFGLPNYLVSPTNLEFGTVSTGDTSGTQQISFTNVTNSTQSYSFAGGAPSGDFNAVQNCAGATLAPGESCQFFYSFSPTSDGSLTGVSNIVVDGEVVSISLNGTGGDSPASSFFVSGTDLSFGHVYEGETSVTQSVNVTNMSDVTQSPSFAGGAPSGDFNAVQNCAGAELAPGESCQFFYTFDPTDEGFMTGTSTIVIDGIPYTVNLDGTGLDPLLVTPTSLDFGAVEVGETSAFQLVSEIINMSGVTQTYSLAGGAPSGDFTAVQNCAGGTLAPGESCQFFYQFAPTTAGELTGQSSFFIDGKQITISLKGLGIGGAPPPTLVSLPPALPMLGLAIGMLPLLVRRRSA